MLDYRSMERRFSKDLGLRRRPVAIAFRDTPPAEVPRFTGTAPSGCSFWRIAADGRTFYTVASDHYNCPIGSYTHHLALPEDRAGELEQTLSLMSGVGYIKMEEVSGIPRLPRPPGVVIYAPLGDNCTSRFPGRIYPRSPRKPGPSPRRTPPCPNTIATAADAVHGVESPPPESGPAREVK